jgi:hypothetical protein
MQKRFARISDLPITERDRKLIQKQQRVGFAFFISTDKLHPKPLPQTGRPSIKAAIIDRQQAIYQQTR